MGHPVVGNDGFGQLRQANARGGSERLTGGGGNWGRDAERGVVVQPAKANSKLNRASAIPLLNGDAPHASSLGNIDRDGFEGGRCNIAYLLLFLVVAIPEVPRNGGPRLLHPPGCRLGAGQLLGVLGLVGGPLGLPQEMHRGGSDRGTEEGGREEKLGGGEGEVHFAIHLPKSRTYSRHTNT